MVAKFTNNPIVAHTELGLTILFNLFKYFFYFVEGKKFLVFKEINVYENIQGNEQYN